MRPHERTLSLELWADKRIEAGHYWSQKIEEKIRAADIHILLVSVGFLASDYIMNNELPAIVERQQQGALTVPIVIERCYWYPFIRVLQAAPINDKGRLLPVRAWKRSRDGMVAACEQLGSAIVSHFPQNPARPIEWGRR